LAAWLKRLFSPHFLQSVFGNTLYRLMGCGG
jgi:hypothetical protein